MKKKLDEASIRYLEEQIPQLAESALRKAFWATLSSGQSVLAVEDGYLCEFFPDGTKKKIKATNPRTPVKTGQKFYFKGHK